MDSDVTLPVYVTDVEAVHSAVEVTWLVDAVLVLVRVSIFLHVDHETASIWSLVISEVFPLDFDGTPITEIHGIFGLPRAFRGAVTVAGFQKQVIDLSLL